MATLRSRCQKLAFPFIEAPLTEEQQERQQRLLVGLEKLSNGSMDPVQFAATWLKDSLSEIVLALTQIVMDMIRLKSSLKMFSYLDELYKIRQALNLAINLNQQLVLENLFITWHEYTHT